MHNRKPRQRSAGPPAAAMAALSLLSLLWLLLIAGPGMDGMDGLDSLVALDQASGPWLRARLPSDLLPWVAGFSDAHRPRGMLLLCGVAALLMGWRRAPGAALWLLAAVASGSMLNHGLKQWLARPRPGAAEAPWAPSDFSFPSGHVVSAAIFYGMLAAWAIARLRSRRARLLVGLAAALMVTLVGLSRVALGAHYPSDVLGALLVGLSWLALWLALARRMRR